MYFSRWQFHIRDRYGSLVFGTVELRTIAPLINSLGASRSRLELIFTRGGKLAARQNEIRISFNKKELGPAAEIRFGQITKSSWKFAQYIPVRDDAMRYRASEEDGRGTS